MRVKPTAIVMLRCEPKASPEAYLPTALVMLRCEPKASPEAQERCDSEDCCG